MVSHAALIAGHRLAQLRLQLAQAEELRWRTLIATHLFPNAVVGTNTNGNVKLAIRENLTLEKDQTKIFTTMNSVLAAFPDDAKTIAGLIETKYEIKPAVWNILSDTIKSQLASIVTSKPGLPSVKYGDE
jgi:hypothetical protein